MRKPAGKNGTPLGPRGNGAGGPYPVPKLEELVANPSRYGELDAYTSAVLKNQAITALNLLNALDLSVARAGIEAPGQQRRDRLINIDQAAEKLGVTKDWLYHHHKEYPFTVRQGKLLRFSELGIEEYIRTRRG